MVLLLCCDDCYVVLGALRCANKLGNPLFDETGILALAQERGAARLFPYHRSHWDRLIKQYGREAGIHPDKCHFHSLKHSIAMILWDSTKSLGQIQNFLGHKAVSSKLCYLREVDASKAHVALAGVTF